MTATEEAPHAGVEEVASYLTERIGLSFSGRRRAHLLRQIAEAMASAATGSGRLYCERLENDEDEFDELVARVTVGESYFFREPRQLDVLRSTIFPERRAARGPGEPLRLWSAGCATGQEPYTLAILLEEERLSGHAAIVATDISREALRVAVAGLYGRWSLRAVTEEQLDAYFHPVAMGYRVDDRFARSISFRLLNLLDPASTMPTEIDVILCRNVLIYFTPDAVRRVAQRLADALVPGGWLVTGSSDPPLHGIGDLEPTVTAAGLVYRRSPASVEDRAVPLPLVAPAPAPTPVAQAQSAARPVVLPVAAPPASVDGGDEVVRAIRALGDAGKLELALDATIDAIERFPLHTELRFLQAVVLLEAGRPADAAVAARAALYLDPELVMAHLVLARAEVALGNQDAARRSLQNAAALLRALPSDAIVPMSDGEPAGRLAAMAAAHRRAVGAGSPGEDKV